MFLLFLQLLNLIRTAVWGRVWRSWITWEQAKETGTSVRESEHRIDVRLFLNEYPRWELGTPHQSVILHKMFLHAAESGQKEVECMVCWGSTSEPDPEAGHSTMELVGYQTSHKEIQDIYQSVYLQWRPPGLHSCGDQLRRRTIWDILSSLKDQLHRHGYPATTGEDPKPQEEWGSRPNRWEPYEEALRAACQRALDTTETLQGDIERLSQRVRDRWQTRSQTCSQSHSKSHSRSRSRSHSRAHSQSHPQSGSQSRRPRSPNGPLPGRRVTFREPEVEPNSEVSAEDYSSESSVSDVETWLEWQAQQLVTFNHWDVVQGLGVIHLGSTSRWPQTTLFSHMLSPPVAGQDFMETTTVTASPIAEEDVTRCTTPLSGTERENRYLLVVTASVGQLNLGPSGNNHERSTADPHDENTFWNPQMAATFSGSTRSASYGGTTVKELNEWRT